ncbi:MAG: FecR domain-containing protein [Stellaceae bacterium]
MRRFFAPRRLALSALLAFGIASAAVAATIGSAVVVVNKVTGKVETAPAGISLRVGIDVQANESVETATASATRLVFQDNTQLEVGPSSQVTLDKFVFDPDPSKSQVALSIARGAARFVTGSLPKPDYELHTPAASIGIRGTILDIDVAPGGASTVYVEQGIALVTGGGHTVELHAGQSTQVLPGQTPGNPITGPNPRPNQLLFLLRQALQSPNGAAEFVRSILALHPQGGPALIDLVAITVEQDPSLAAAFVSAGQSTSTTEQFAIGAALGQAAAYFYRASNSAAVQTVVAAMGSAPPAMQTAYANNGGTNHNLLPLPILTGAPPVVTNTCISPSQPGGRC